METVKDNLALEIADQGGLLTESEGAATLHQVSLRTNVHDEGSDANDTADGLTDSEEAVRHAAEDIPTAQRPEGPIETVPVFDRGSLPPKI
ncbi:hypothetical protein IP69_06925 [Bosea sp. AAP35]|uniref:hypothetical protein n=1 Tax=Bosea sp. AAP35 TaxID=1523417 RepID=UPI0006B8E734|nr:hypothetical protein [Bosea sp. AAP35]KPF71063.1 hypothetical protein IP69_06925 [Bosea sp. AAP35]